MGRKLQHIADRKAKDPTAKNRMKTYRLRKAGHSVEGICPKCSEEFHRQMDCGEVSSDVTVSAAQKWEEARRRERAWVRKLYGLDLKDEFKKLTGVTVSTKEATRAAWKKHAAAIHPDWGGDPAVASAFGELWAKLVAINRWEGASA